MANFSLFTPSSRKKCFICRFWRWNLHLAKRPFPRMFQRTNLLNKVSTGEVLAEIGLARYRDFRELIRSLYGNESKLTFRFAPSIILRSELEMFDVSTPRFAIRALVREKETGRLLAAVNIRRLLTFARQQSNWLFEDWTDENEKKPSDVIQNARSIADSFFSLPAHLSAKFHSIGIRWGRLTGDLERNGPEQVPAIGTPFMNHIPLVGGGMCAQACAFMCATLLQEYATHVHGLAEVTYLATSHPDENRRQELKISGLTPQELARYFQAIGLLAESQEVLHESGASARGSQVARSGKLLNKALRAYLMSDMPVTMAVDMVRMKGLWNGMPPYGTSNLSFYKLNARTLPRSIRVDPPDETPHGSASEPHMVVLVGCTAPTESSALNIREANSGPEIPDDDFLVHDPATVPFHCVPLSVLRDCLLVDPAKRDVTNPAAQCFPVVPKAVRLPLLDYRFEGEKPIHGLLYRASRHRERARDEVSPPGTALPIPMNGGSEFEWLRLTRIGKISDLSKVVGFRWISEHMSDLAIGVAQLSSQLGWNKEHWVWCESVACSLWVWDAEQQPPPANMGKSPDSERGFLRWVFQPECGVWHYFNPKSVETLSIARTSELRLAFEAQSNEEDEVEERVSRSGLPAQLPHEAGELKSSLITSVTLKGLKKASVLWKKGASVVPNAIDLYACMQADADLWFGSRWRRRSSPWYRAAGKFGQRTRKAILSRHLNRPFTYRLADLLLSIFEWTANVRWGAADSSPRCRKFCAQWHRFRSAPCRPTAMAILSEANAKEIQALASRLTRLSSPCPIISIATYFPELASDLGLTASEGQSGRWEQAQSALINLVKLAANLGQQARKPAEASRPPIIVELVAGTRLQGLARKVVVDRSGREQREYIAQLEHAGNARHELLRRLEPVANVAREVGVLLAIELEPGPFALLSKLVHLREVCDRLASEEFRDGSLVSSLGFNLDIPHWAFLSDITINALSAPPNECVLKRIVHSHVSDHSNGHFADNDLGTIHKKSDFIPWLTLLAKRQSMQEGGLPFSGHVALELEACEDTAPVERSLRTLDTWMAEAAQMSLG